MAAPPVPNRWINVLADIVDPGRIRAWDASPRRRPASHRVVRLSRCPRSGSLRSPGDVRPGYARPSRRGPGLRGGRRGATQWSRAGERGRRYAGGHVGEDRSWVGDGSVYTSAGVSAGIDVALALIEGDLGPDLALAVARAMVVYLRRP